MASDDYKTRTIAFFATLWLNDAPSSISLEQCIRDCFAVLTSVNMRSVIRTGGQYVKVARYQQKAVRKGVFLHIVADTPGEYASVVPANSVGKHEIDVGAAPPPTDNEYMDADSFLHVVGDHVLFCATNLRDASIAWFLQELFKIAKIRKDAVLFELSHVADVNRLKLIRTNGVESVELGAVMHEATASYQNRKLQPHSLLGAIGRQFVKLLGKENDVTNDALRVKIIVTSDGRMKSGLKLGEKRIRELAEQIVSNQEEGDDYVIVTKKGQKIKAKEIYYSKKVEIKRKAKSVEFNGAWSELEKYFAELKETGALE